LSSRQSVSQLKKIIYPVKLSDVVIRLDRPEKFVNITFCVREKYR
jgi:hypothetical protein